jgi:ATP phosphoribosyltransferase
MMITLALSKGRIFDDTLPLLRATGIEVLEDPEKSRKLILPTSRADVQIIMVRASDVPTYVQYGGADLGVVGKDTLLETGVQGLYVPLDLKIAKCRVSVAVREGFDYAAAVNLIKLYGSMELAPLTGMADAIVDLVSTGSTLKANKLIEVERIMEISSRLVVNQTSLKTKQAVLKPILAAFESAVA